MKNGNFFCKVNCPQQDRGVFFSQYREVLSRSQEFNATFVSLPNGTAIGVSYISSLPDSDRIIYRYDILWNEEVERQLRACGADIAWDETRFLVKRPGRYQEEAEIIPSTDVEGVARISNGQGFTLLNWGGL